MNLRSVMVWERVYDVIRRDLGFDYSSDCLAATVLSEILQSWYGGSAQGLISKLKELVSGYRVLVVGAYDTCLRCAEVARQYDLIIAADGASLCCIESGLMPDVIVTDLDGILSAADERGLRSWGSALLVVHAHGDNLDALVRYVPLMLESNEVVGTCQVRPPHPLRVFGGFTDGDRAAYLAYYFGASKLGFLGFNLAGEAVGRYSKPGGRVTSLALKARKLKWASTLLAYLRQACCEEGIDWAEEG